MNWNNYRKWSYHSGLSCVLGKMLTLFWKQWRTLKHFEHKLCEQTWMLECTSCSIIQLVFTRMRWERRDHNHSNNVVLVEMMEKVDKWEMVKARMSLGWTHTHTHVHIYVRVYIQILIILLYILMQMI